jgi:hypothetical protein
VTQLEQMGFGGSILINVIGLSREHIIGRVLS